MSLKKPIDQETTNHLTNPMGLKGPDSQPSKVKAYLNKALLSHEYGYPTDSRMMN